MERDELPAPTEQPQTAEAQSVSRSYFASICLSPKYSPFELLFRSWLHATSCDVEREISDDLLRPGFCSVDDACEDLHLLQALLGTPHSGDVPRLNTLNNSRCRVVSWRCLKVAACQRQPGPRRKRKSCKPTLRLYSKSKAAMRAPAGRKR